jgi:hypothetical protein
MGYYFGKDIKAPIAVPETCNGGYPQPAGQPCPQGFKSKVINGANMCCQEAATQPTTPATAGTTAVKAAPIPSGPTVQPQATSGYGGAILSSLMGAGQAMPAITPPVAPEVAGITQKTILCKKNPATGKFTCQRVTPAEFEASPKEQQAVCQGKAEGSVCVPVEIIFGHVVCESGRCVAKTETQWMSMDPVTRDALAAKCAGLKVRDVCPKTGPDRKSVV